MRTDATRLGEHRPSALLSRNQTPRPVVLISRMMLVALAITAAFLTWAPWQQVAAGSGRVLAYAPADRQQTVDAPVDGRIVRWHVQEGAVVKAGAPLVELSDVDPLILMRLGQERDSAHARLAAARARADGDKARIESLTLSRKAAVEAAQQRVGMATERARAADQALAAAEANRVTARLNLTRQAQLKDSGLASQRALELAQLDMVRADTEVDRAQASLTAAKTEEGALRSDVQRTASDADAAINAAKASLASAQSEIASATGELARMDVRVARQSSQQMMAPRDGMIMRVVANQEGAMVKAGETLAVLVPQTDDRAVELWVDGLDAPLIIKGRHVRLQFEGWPAVQFTGWPSVAVGTFGGLVAVVDAAADSRGRSRVLVVPDPADEPWPQGRYLRQGNRANGWVFLSRVRLAFEVWRQINGFPPTVPMPADEDKEKESK